MPVDAAGSYIESISFFLTNEDGKELDLQGGRVEMMLALSWPSVKGEQPPPSSFAARTDIATLLQPWAAGTTA